MNNLQNLQNKISGFWIDKPIKKAYLFGSAVRQELLPDSDILVELDQSKLIGMIQYIKIIQALENLLQRKVDLVTNDGLSPYIKPIIDREKLLSYEK